MIKVSAGAKRKTHVKSILNFIGREVKKKKNWCDDVDPRAIDRSLKLWFQSCKLDYHPHLTQCLSSHLLVLYTVTVLMNLNTHYLKVRLEK